MTAKRFIRTIEAGALLDRGVRRVQQLIRTGVLEGGQIAGLVSLSSVLKYQRGIKSGEIRPGPKGPRNGVAVKEDGTA